MRPILRYTFLTALRDRLYVGLLVTLAAAFSISALLGSTALVEQDKMAMVYVAGSTRFVCVIGVILFVCFHIRRAFENREIEFMISKAISRNEFVLAYWIGFTLVALAVVIPLAVFVAILTSADSVGVLFWAVSLIFEISLVVTFSLVASLILKSAVSAVLASFGFYFISRMMGFFVLTIEIPESFGQVLSFKGAMEAILKLLSVLFPRLDLFGKSEWLVYGMSDYSNVGIFAAQSLVYIPLMLWLAFYDFSKKQF